MNNNEIAERLFLLEYHQKLLLKMVSGSTQQFYKLVIEKSLSEKDVNDFNNICDKLSIELEEQKAEGFVYFHPLFEELKASLPPNIDINDVIDACLQQQLYVPLMNEFKKYITY